MMNKKFQIKRKSNDEKTTKSIERATKNRPLDELIQTK